MRDERCGVRGFQTPWKVDQRKRLAHETGCRPLTCSNLGGKNSNVKNGCPDLYAASFSESFMDLDQALHTFAAKQLQTPCTLHFPCWVVLQSSQQPPYRRDCLVQKNRYGFAINTSSSRLLISTAEAHKNCSSGGSECWKDESDHKASELSPHER